MVCKSWVDETHYVLLYSLCNTYHTARTVGLLWPLSLSCHIQHIMYIFRIIIVLPVGFNRVKCARLSHRSIQSPPVVVVVVATTAVSDLFSSLYSFMYELEHTTIESHHRLFLYFSSDYLTYYVSVCCTNSHVQITERTKNGRRGNKNKTTTTTTTTGVKRRLSVL